MKLIPRVMVLAALPLMFGAGTAPPKGDLASVVIQIDDSFVEIGNIVSTGRAFLQKELPKVDGLDRLKAKVYVNCGQHQRPFRLLLYGNPGEQFYNVWFDSNGRVQAFERRVESDIPRP